MSRFEDRVAIVIGGSCGIGLAAAVRLGSEGARVIIANRDLEERLAAVGRVKSAGAPDDLAGAIAFLASGDAQFITGTALNVDGGRLAKL